MNSSKPQERKLWFMAAVTVTAVAVGLFFLLSAIKTGRKVIVLPTEDEVEKVTVKVNDLEKEMALRPIPAFDVPKRYIRLLLSALKPTEIDNQPTQWERTYEKLGEITIRTRAGKQIRVELYNVGRTVAGFTVDGVRCFRGGEHKPVRVSGEIEEYVDESLLLILIITEMHKETNHKKSRLAHYVETLQRSRGEMAPIDDSKGNQRGGGKQGRGRSRPAGTLGNPGNLGNRPSS